MPIVAFRITESPAQNVGEPVNAIVLSGNWLTVTFWVADVVEQPLLFVT